ncbi:MAG: hypothetical protein Q8P39_01250 [Candidatus Yanofskybacteria bacterium]|nr:hypothetical protein [Candidatus Yanofskybacteria bacterium]
MASRATCATVCAMAALDKERVQDLYQSGLSAKEVGEKLDVSMWVVYKFMHGHGLARRTRYETNRLKFEASAPSFSLKAERTEEEEKLFVAGLMLYWGEGTKQGRKNNWTVEFSNSNPLMVQVFLKFLRQLFVVDEKRLRAYIFCYADQNLPELKDFWSAQTRIPLSQFPKPYIHEKTTRKTRETKYGTMHLRYSDKRLLILIEQLIEKYAQSWVGTQVANEVAL